MPFELDFPITRKYSWRYFTPIVLAASTVILVALTVVNVRLVGFETITKLEDDFNVTQSLWLEGIIPKALLHGQNLCQPSIFKMGDSFVTNSSIFLYNLELVSNPDHNTSSLVYEGSTLRDCDVISIYLDGNMVPPTLDVVAVISCKDLDGFDVIAKTAFPVSLMPGTYTRYTGKLSTFSSLRSILPYRLIYLAALDILRHQDTLANFTQGYYGGSLSAEISYIPCPASLGTGAPCANNPPPVNITSSVITTFREPSPNPIYSYNVSALHDYDMYESVANLIQTIHAAVQLDLGNSQENNFLLNPSVLNKTLYCQFPSILLPKPTVSNLYQVISDPGDFFGAPAVFPFEVDGPAKLEARFLCQVQQMKEPAQAFIAVLVATLSMFVSGWGLFMLVATYWAKRSNNAANTCIAYDIEQALLPVAQV